MSLPGYDDWLQNGDYAQDAYGESMEHVNMNDAIDNLHTIKTTAELEPGDVLELLGDPVFDDEYLDDPDLSPWNYEFGEVAEVREAEGFENMYEITLTDGSGGVVRSYKTWKVVE